MRGGWISLSCVLVLIGVVQVSYTSHSAMRCECNGRARYCVRDGGGLRCVDCQGNTEGRNCERCKDGFYQQGAGQSCSPCLCHALGSVSPQCDSRGRCSCKDGVTGEKCDRCPDGPIGPNGCKQSRWLREDSGSWSPPCFCYGHSSRCSPRSGFTTHAITSRFTHGPEGWRAATAQGVTPNDVHFRWSPKHQDLEVISQNSLPAFLHAPAVYLGNQLLSYGQNLSFSLRLDRGVRHPSTNDVVLEGSGLRVSASLGDLRSLVPCGQKITYTFRLDERPGSRWRPPLTPFQFQTLLQNLTAIRIRATFGENGRGYLDNVELASARPGGGGAPAGWVQSCSCPAGHEGERCERCSSGFRWTHPARGAFSTCEPCTCRGGSCDPQTGDCYSADETPAGTSCPAGFYSDPRQPGTCATCPCPDGVSCSLPAGSLQPRCDLCPPGTTGPRCDRCEEGFYGDPAGREGVRRPCRPCQCNGHVDLSVAGSCDRSSGECLKCLNNTKGRSCEACLPGFYHGRPADACKPCGCDLRGSLSAVCDDSGRCQCRPSFDGLKCQRSACPACFSLVKEKVEAHAVRLHELETLFSGADGGLKPIDSKAMEKILTATEELVTDLQDSTEDLAAMEKRLQGRLSAISQNQLTESQDIQTIADTADDIKRRQETYRTKAEQVQELIEEMKRKLEEAKSDLRSAEFPQGDAAQGSDFLSTLVQTATSLADKHQTKADTVEQSANEALSDSEKSLALVRTLMNKENKVKELIGDLKAMYDDASSRVKSLESRAARLGDEAKGESKMADGMLKEIARMEKEIPSALKLDDVVSWLDGLKTAADGNITGYQDLQDGVQEDKAAVDDLLARGNAAQQESDKLLARVDAAKAEAEDALRRINNNADELDDALRALTGFDKQMEDAKSLADAAIKRLPAINATIQQAVRDNKETLSVLDNVTGDYNDSLGTIDLLKNLITGLQGTSGSLPPYGNLPKDAAKLNDGVKQLKTSAADTAAELSAELDDARRLEDEAEEANIGAAAAFRNAKHARDAVGKALTDVNNLLGAIGQPGSVDEDQVTELEKSLANANNSVNKWLKPQLRDMEEQEDAHRRRLNNINLDIDNILQDITNLEDILRSVPSGCFNSPPIEEA